jgi:G protein-coupled receptor GPR1
MSLHMSLQIFSTGSKIFGSDGLYRFRHTVLGGSVVFPFLCAVLAFIRGRQGYIAQGPFCTLPIRPYWYRLALQWIPRYLTWLYIMFVAFRIYLHVGQAFKIFAREDDLDSSTSANVDGLESAGTVPGEGPQDLHVSYGREPSVGNVQDVSDLMESNTASSQAPTRSSSQGKQSTRPTFLNSPSEDFKVPSAGHPGRGSPISIPGKRTIHHELFQVPSEVVAQRSSVPGNAVRGPLIDINAPTKSHSVNLACIGERCQQMMSRDKADRVLDDTPFTKRRRAIQRQMRLLFIYPITYLMVWTIPFIYHSFNYSDKYAANPIAFLALLSTFCVTIAGTVDCVVFGWREKPWQHISGADGTFLGSFKFWAFTNSGARRWVTSASGRLPSLGTKEERAGRSSENPSRPRGRSQVCCTNSTKVMVPLHKKTFSGTSDRAIRAAEGAAERLALERADRQNRKSTRDPSIDPAREWFERRLSACLSLARVHPVNNIMTSSTKG